MKKNTEMINEPVKIINFDVPQANYYRAKKRRIVDIFFEKKEKLIEHNSKLNRKLKRKPKNAKELKEIIKKNEKFIMYNDSKARKIWREILTEANKIK